MNEFELDAELAAANPITEQSVASVVPPGVGEAMLREITAVERSSRPALFFQRLEESIPGGFGLGRAAFVGAVAAVLLVVGAAATVIRSGQEITDPAEDSVLDEATEQVETPRPVLDASEDPDLGDPAADDVGVGGVEAETESDGGGEGTNDDTSDESMPVPDGADDADGSVNQDPDQDESGGDAADASDADTPATEPEDDPIPDDDPECVAYGTTLTRAITAYSNSCAPPRGDCDPIDGRWMCSSEQLGELPSGFGPDPSGGSGQDSETSAPASGGGSAASTGSFDTSRDLLSLHFDHAPDLDDGHATVAARVITDSLGISPWVVGGAYGSNGGGYQVDSEQVMDATWNKDGWMNAHDNWSNAVVATANRWQATLNDGGDVWVAEGGQSNLTADVVRELLVRDQRLDVSSRIHVVQHSDWNESKTSPADLSYVRGNTDYIRIEDGNWRNATADLNTVTAGWERRARASRWGTAWSAAFDYLDPADRLDFSDTVEVLYIVGIGIDQVGTTAEFANRFFG